MNFPNIFGVIPGFDTPLKYLSKTKSVADGDMVEKDIETVWFRASLSPLSGQQVAIKPEGQRLWTWSEIFTKQLLPPDGVLEDTDGIQYRVRTKHNWIRGGFYRYEITEGFQ